MTDSKSVGLPLADWIIKDSFMTYLGHSEDILQLLFHYFVPNNGILYGNLHITRYIYQFHPVYVVY